MHFLIFSFFFLMPSDIGNISLFADLDRVSSREAAAIQSIESKLLGNDPGGLGALAQVKDVSFFHSYAEKRRSR